MSNAELSHSDVRPTAHNRPRSVDFVVVRPNRSKTRYSYSNVSCSGSQLFTTFEERRHMELSRGTITPHRLFSVRDMGLGNPEPHVDRVIKAFLGIGEAVAARWIQMPKAILLLQMAPEDPA